MTSNKFTLYVPKYGLINPEYDLQHSCMYYGRRLTIMGISNTMSKVVCIPNTAVYILHSSYELAYFKQGRSNGHKNPKLKIFKSHASPHP